MGRSLALAIAILIAVGCSRSDSESPVTPPASTASVTSAWDLVAKASRRVEALGVDEVAEQQTAGALLVDLRETEERLAHGAIPGALHAPRGMLEFWADPSSPVHRPEFDPGRPVILFCAIGGRSALAAATLLDMGYEQVSQMRGGFAAWLSAGRPVEAVGGPSEEIVAYTGVTP